jgi:hypothetical protein
VFAELVADKADACALFFQPSAVVADDAAAAALTDTADAVAANVAPAALTAATCVDPAVFTAVTWVVPALLMLLMILTDRIGPMAAAIVVKFKPELRTLPSSACTSLSRLMV